MLLTNLELLESAGSQWLKIESGKFTSSSIWSGDKAYSEEDKIEFENAIAFPGLINSHDHLEFNLFPKLGNKRYKDYVEWGEDIHRVNKDEIERIKKIPRDERIAHGIHKNILNGVTTVVDHGSYSVQKNYLIDVFTQYNYLHSIRLEKNWKAKLLLTLNKKPFVIHIGEGTNDEAYSEINELIRWNIFHRKIIGVHAIMMDEKQAAHFKAVVWCPDSNNFLYGKTSCVDKLKRKTNILFGTDSTVSAGWNLWDHLRLARSTNLLTDQELYNSLTSSPAKIWNLKRRGAIAKDFDADIVIAEKKSDNFFNSFFSIDPKDILMIIKSGDIILFDERLLNKIGNRINLPDYARVEQDKAIKFLKTNSDKGIGYFNSFR